MRSAVLRGIAASLLITAGTVLAQEDERAYPAARGGGNYMHNYYLPPPSSTPWRPAWSPDGKEIAFSMSGSIWKIRVGDTVAYELTSNRTYDSSPAWSPDGRWIVYTADDSGKSINLMLLNTSTGESVALTRGKGLNLDPAWSPDGGKLAHVATGADGSFHIFSVPMDNGRPGQPLQVTTSHRYGRARLYFADADIHIQPTWSPDGKELIAVSNRGIPLGSGAVWRMPLQPDAMSQAKQILREETLYRTQPQWSRDGKRILYSSHRGSQFNNLYVLPANGGEPYQLTFGHWDHFDPRWSPDGEWIVYVSNQHGLSDLRLLRTFGGEERRIQILRRVYRRPMGTLEGVVKDGGAGSLTSARIYLTASDGKTYAPADAYHRIGIALEEHLFHTSGRFQVDVPAGKVSVEAMKGLERSPVSQTAEIRAGGVTTVTLELPRITNMKAAGWFSGSNHIHMNYGGNLHNTPENLIFIASAEDNDVIGEKVANKDNRIFDHQYFTGKPDERSTAEHLLFFDEEYRPPFYGHISFINLTKHLISPFTTGYEGTAIESLYPSNTDIFRLTRAQGALNGYVHPWRNDPTRSGYGVARGYPVDVALGMLDYLELMAGSDHLTTTGVWHRSLNCGFKISATAGEDSIVNLHRSRPVGLSRTYAHLGPKLDWRRWVEAIREGRTFVTNGPLISFQVDGRMPGDEVRLPDTGGSVEIALRMQSIVPVDKVEVLFNGRVAETLAGGTEAELRKRIAVKTSGWLTVRAYGTKPVHPIDDRYVFGETGPVYVYCGDRPIRSREDAAYFIRWIDEITRQANAHPGWRSEGERRHVLGQFAEARKVFEQRAREAATQ